MRLGNSQNHILMDEVRSANGHYLGVARSELHFDLAGLHLLSICFLS